MSNLERWDAFISHASEDKQDFVRALADKLTDLGVTVWYDEFTLEVGDSLSGSIDNGLSKSEYGIVVLSKKFFEKGWTKKELHTLETKAANLDRSIILPVWHKITKQDITGYSSTLADIVALNSSEGIDIVASKLAKKIKGIKIEQYQAPEVLNTSNVTPEEYIFFSKWDLSEQSDKFYYTEGIDMDSDNFVYVADEGGYVRKFDSIGSMVGKWGGKGNNDGEFQTAYALATDSSNNVVVTDAIGRIQKFNCNGTFLMKWGASGQESGEFGSPFGIEIDKFGNIFVCEEGNHRVQKFDSNGEFLTKWGDKGNADGQFNDPIGIAADSLGNIYVADYLNHRIQVFDNNGKFLRKWGSLGKREGEFDHPHGITLDKKDLVYISDSLNNRIQKFTNSGVFITSWGSEGEADGQLKIPRDLVVDNSGVVYVSDGSNQRVQVFVPKNSNAIMFLKDLQDKRKNNEEFNQLKFYVDKILSDNKNAAEAAWKGIELLARRSIISSEIGVWDAVSKEILQTEPGYFAREALDLLKTMLYTSKALQKSNNVASSKAKELYQEKLIVILESVNVTWQHQKLFAKQILDEIVTENERWSIYWRAWKKNAVDNPDDFAFLKYTGYFIRDLENSSSGFKKSIELEIFDLILSSNTLISNRAKDMHSLLFSQ